MSQLIILVKNSSTCSSFISIGLKLKRVPIPDTPPWLNNYFFAFFSFTTGLSAFNGLPDNFFRSSMFAKYVISD